MKKYFILLFIALTSQLLAQNVLTLTNPRNGEKDIFRKGSFLVFELKADNSTHEGMIRDITDSAIVFDYAQVSFSQIHVLAGTTKSRIVAGKVANSLGTALVIAGSTTFNFGWNFFYGDYYYWPIGGTIWMAGAFATGLGYALDWATPSDYRVRVRNYRNWEAKIVPEEVQIVNHDTIYPPADTTHSDGLKHRHHSRKQKSTHGDDVYGD